MKAAKFLIFASLCGAVSAAELPHRSRFPGDQADDNHLRHLIENTEVERPPAVSVPAQTEEPADPHIQEEPKFAQVSAEEYGEYKKGIEALHKILKPENMKTLKKLTALLTQHHGSPQAGGATGMTPEKLTALVTSAMATQPAGFDYSGLNRALENWKQQMAQGPFAHMFPAEPQPQPATQFVQPAIPYAAVPTAQLPMAATPSFAQVAPVQYAPPMIPYFQIVPQPAAYQLAAQAPPAEEEFRSPQQLLSIQM